MILAAGRGVRMGELTAERPKPLLEVGSRSLLERHLLALARSGVSDVVINLSYRGDQIRAFVSGRSDWGVRVRFSEEGEPPLETAGGIVNALPLLGREPFVLVNADVFTDFDFARLRAARGIGTLVLVSNPDHRRAGDFGIDAQERVTAAPARFTFAGISLLDPALFTGLAPGRRPLKPVLDAAIEARQLYALPYRGVWIDVGTPARLADARALAATVP
jgi:N-acetyl-alpha-D-muramate 1-phosphate uridylyltransferase